MNASIAYATRYRDVIALCATPERAKAELENYSKRQWGRFPHSVSWHETDDGWRGRVLFADGLDPETFIVVNHVVLE